MTDKINIPAIHEDDLMILLEKHGLIEKIREGSVHCVYCGDVISFENLYAIFFKNNSPHFVCDAPECVTKAGQENG